MEQIIISNGAGTTNLNNGNYSVELNAIGYNNLSINPSSIEIVEGTNEYNFTVAATGTLTLHVTENGTADGTAIVGATFIRTDKDGNEYGAVITTDESGNAVFNNVPFAETGAPNVYYKQKGSGFGHTFSNLLVTTTLTTEQTTTQITNALAAQRTISLTDLNYSGLPIENASIRIS